MDTANQLTATGDVAKNAGNAKIKPRFFSKKSEEKRAKNASPADLRRPKARWRRTDDPADHDCLEGSVFGDTMETQRMKNDVGTVANLAGAANTKSRLFAKARRCPPRFSSLMTRTDNGSGRARTGTATPADLRPPKDRGPFLFVFPASRRTDPRVHCPHLKSRNSTMCPLKNKVCGGSEPVLAQRNPSRFSLSTTRADNGSARPRTGTEIPADLRQPKDRGPFFVCPSSAPTTGSAPTAPTCNQGMVRCTLYELWCALALHRSCPENPWRLS